MPPLIAFALIGAGVYAGYRAARLIFSHESATLRDEPDQSSQQPVEKDLGALEYDPSTGSYRPASRN